MCYDRIRTWVRCFRPAVLPGIGLLLPRVELLPDEIVLPLIERKLEELNGKWILDGFPRTASQAETIKPLLDHHFVAISIDVPEQVLRSRLANRWVHLPSGRTYALDGFSAPRSPGLDDVTGEPLIRRSDDASKAAFATRLKVFKNNMPLIKQELREHPWIEVSGESSAVIYEGIQAALRRMTAARL